MPRNHHKCDDKVTNFIIECAEVLHHKKCNSKHSHTFPGSVLNNVFNTNYFNYTYNYRICHFFMLKLSNKDIRKYNLLQSSLRKKNDVDIITSPEIPSFPPLKSSMRDIFFSKLSDVMRSISNRLSYRDLHYRQRRMREDEISLFILLHVIDLKKFREEGYAYIQKNKKQICIHIVFMIDVAKLHLGRLFL